MVDLVLVGLGAALWMGSDSAPAPVVSEPLGSEEDLLGRLRDEVDRNPAQALELAAEGERRHPGGRSADERELLRMRALVHLGEISAAREAAARFFERYPNSPFGPQVSRLTGRRPRPRPPPTSGKRNRVR